MEEKKQQDTPNEQSNSVKSQLLSMMMQHAVIINASKQEFHDKLNELQPDEHDERLKLYQAQLAVLELADATLKKKITEILNT